MCFVLSSLALLAGPKTPSPIISVGADGRLKYDSDAQGNRVPDFSSCGYAGANRAIPDAPARVTVAPGKGDSTARIQAAIDYVAGLPLDSNGLRGAVLLLKGRHEVSGSLRLNASGVVLRGQGMDSKGTVLVATGLDRRTLIRIAGRNDRAVASGKSWAIKDEYVPVGATTLRVDHSGGLKPGDTVSVIRPCTQAWIERLGTTQFAGSEGDWRLTWKPGSRDLVWDREVRSVEGEQITLDAPITTAIESAFGGGRVEAYDWPGRLQNVGVENLRCESTFDAANPKDENHSWFAVTMDNARDAWVRQVTALHFAGSMVAVYETCKRVTVEDCLSLAPVSEEGGYRRHTFFTMGQMTLFLHCHAERGRHDFSAGYCAAGPNAFVQCDATPALADSGAIESWASGVLYDCVNIDGNGLSLGNRGANPHGAGWAAANSVLWQCSASVIECVNPPTARNWSFGCWGEFAGDGVWRSCNESVRPYSLYRAQLEDRLGAEAARRVSLLLCETDGPTNPTIEQAARLIAAARKPVTTLADYIASAGQRQPIASAPGDARPAEDLTGQAADNTAARMKPESASKVSHSPKLLTLTNGWLVRGGELLIGKKMGVPWWRGNIHPNEAASAEPAVTRFVPGRVGRGFTDDLEEVADGMEAEGVSVLDHHYGLWYERRRDDHERVRRINGDVWPPFYEMPFARTGQGVAWNGLSLYDLTKYNPWYWDRLRKFAEVCDQRGLVLFHANFFQHHILEAGAHWADSPWRTANNVNNPGFPEPPPYAGDKRIFMAEQFYDVTNAVRRKIYQAYIRQCLENFKDNANVIQFTSAEYTGPLGFTQFWIDTVGDWKRQARRKPLIALSCTKDVQDAILQDAERSRWVDVIDFQYWWKTDKGTYAPGGGLNLAPRQFQRQWRGGAPNDKNLAQMAAEYRGRYPDKAIICDFSQGAWEFVCAGGSIPNLPGTTDSGLLAAIPRMTASAEGAAARRWVLREPGSQYLVCAAAGGAIDLDLSAEKGVFAVRAVDPATGAVEDLGRTVAGGKVVSLPKPAHAPAILWITRQP